MEVGIIDYGGGNLRSVERAVARAGGRPFYVGGRGELGRAEAVVFPGQGSFGEASERLAELGLVAPLVEWVRAGRPFLGICLGYQLLFEGSEESPGTAGFGILKGRVKRFEGGGGLKVPHMGWNQLELVDGADPLWAGVGEVPYVYFVHSYYPAPEDAGVVGSWCDYGVRFAASVRLGERAVATQFHPEKSQGVGLRLLENFLRG
jgi:imidazole glycerol-phosphate synthase subunit HisH